MTGPTPAALADSVPWPLGRQRMARRAEIANLTETLKALRPFGERWNATYRDLLFAERQLADLEGKDYPPVALGHAETAAVVAHASVMPVEEADRLIDKAYHPGGIAWLRATGFASAKHPHNVRATVDTDSPAVDTGEDES